MKTHIIMLALGIGILGTALLGSPVFAQDELPTNPVSSLVQKIANKFSLDQDQVQAVFDEAREEHQAERQGAYAARLTQLVTDGKITEDQKSVILSKHAQLQADHESARENQANLTPEQRREARESERQALEDWAEENGIDANYLMFGGTDKGHGEFRGFGRGHLSESAE